jgi:DNA-binding MarR family transcriptional regulator
MNVEISEKEFAVIHEISNNHLPDQRTIASRAGISLGMTNLIIKRLIMKGYVKAKQLNQKKIQYLLTPKGFSEKAKKSYNFTIKTVDMFKALRLKIRKLIEENFDKGASSVTIIGNTELAEIAELTLRNMNLPGVTYTRKEPDQSGAEEIFLVFEKPGKEKLSSVGLLSYLSNSGIYFE